jgi:hypothetical protein
MHTTVKFSDQEDRDNNRGYTVHIYNDADLKYDPSREETWICTVAFAISYNHEYSQFIHECTIAVMNTTLSWMRQLIHEG